jgi:hypothetical protein
MAESLYRVLDIPAGCPGSDVELTSVAMGYTRRRGTGDMNRLDLPSSMVAREELEEAWRQKTQEAQERYRVATERYHRLLKESQGRIPTADSPLVVARHEQSAALDEYKRVLGIFTEFTVHGQTPETKLTKNGDQS